MNEKAKSVSTSRTGVPAAFFPDLEAIYLKDKGLVDYWKSEKPQLQAIMPRIAEAIAYNYDIQSPLAVGGGGVIALVKDRNLDTIRVLKTSRPSPGKERLLAGILASETQNLKRLSHQNLIRIFAQGVIEHDGESVPFYVMDFVEGAKDADKYFAKDEVGESELLKVIGDAIAAIAYLHSNGTIHLDIKPANLLVTPSPVGILSDLGFAKQLKNDAGYTLIGGTDGFIHPGARQFLTELTSDPNRLRGEALRTAVETKWDIYSFGKTLFNLLAVLDQRKKPPLRPYVRRYLRLMASRMLDGYNEEGERALGLPITTINEIKYETIEQVSLDFSKLIGAYNINRRIPELDAFLQDTIQMSSIAQTPFTARVREIVSDTAFTRLDNVAQLGLVNYVYPTATHSRYAHSLGTFSVLVRFIVALYNDTLNPLFRQIMDESDLKATLLAALLHDLGQYPLAHDLEEAEPKVFSHEEITKLLLSNDRSIVDKIREHWDIESSRILSILAAKPNTLEGTLKDRILHSLIDGPIDADKLDYLVRDGEECKLVYGRGLDTERLFKSLTIVFREQDEHTYAALGIHEKGKIPAEDVAWARYKMFGQVYWHHTYRAVKAMIHRMAWEMLLASAGCNDVRDDFRKLVTPSNISEVEPTLFSNFPDTGPQIASRATRIHFADMEVLSYIAVRSGTTGKELFEMIKARRLFKRVLVLAHDRTPDKQVWEKISEFYRLNAKHWERKLKLQNHYQSKLVSLAENPIGTEPARSGPLIDNDAKNRFIVEGKTKVLILIDFPPERGGSSSALEYVIEEDRRRYKSDELQTGSLEESVIWKTLQAKFHESIGKLRVFSHPDHETFIRTFFSREQMERALLESIRKVSAE